MSQVAAPVRARTPRGEKTRQLLLQAAEAVFGEKGFDQAAISEITQRAGVAQGTFYVYFPDKKDIFVQLVRELHERLRQAVLAGIGDLTDRVEIERARFRAFFDFVSAHRNLYRIVRQAEFVDEDLYRWYYRSLAEGYAQGLAASMEEGRIAQADPEAIAYCLMGIADFLGMRFCLWDKRRPSEAVFSDVLSFVQRGLAKDP